MTGSNQQRPFGPWSTGPLEILAHANELLRNDTDVARRLAMILVDNAVEQALRTFLELPTRISGLRLTRSQRDSAGSSFPTRLEALETAAPGELAGFPIGEIEWFHQIRNNLYHEGIGLTVTKEQVELYSALARRLMTHLLGTPPAAPFEEAKPRARWRSSSHY